jgi:hypothetical protein
VNVELQIMPNFFKYTTKNESVNTGVSPVISKKLTSNTPSDTKIPLETNMKAGARNIVINEKYIYDAKLKQLDVTINRVTWNKLKQMEILFSYFDIVSIQYKLETITGNDPKCTVFEFIYILYTNPKILKNLTVGIS